MSTTEDDVSDETINRCIDLHDEVITLILPARPSADDMATALSVVCMAAATLIETAGGPDNIEAKRTGAQLVHERLLGLLDLEGDTK